MTVDNEKLPTAAPRAGRWRGAIVLLLAAASVSSALALWAWQRKSPATIASAPSADGAVEALKRRVDALEREQALYRGLLLRAQAAAAAPGAASDAARATPPQAAEPADDRTPREVYEDLRASYASEAVDRAWGPKLEAGLFETVKSFQGVTARAVGCRSTMCELDIGFENLEAREQFEMSFSAREHVVGKQVWTQRLEEKDGALRSILLVMREESRSR